MKFLIKLVCGLFALSGSILLSNKVFATIYDSSLVSSGQGRVEMQDKKVDDVSLRIERLLDSASFDMSKFYFSNLIKFLRANGVMQRLDDGSEKLNLDLLKEKIKNEIVNVDILDIYLRYAEEEIYKAETASVIFPEVELKKPKFSDVPCTDLKMPSLKQPKLTTDVIGECKLTNAKKGEASMKEFFSSLFKDKSLTNEIIRQGSSIYLSEMEFLFYRLVIGYDVEKIGKRYICKLNSSCNGCVYFKSFLLLEPFLQIDNCLGFKIKSLYVIKDDKIILADKRELIEQLINELTSSLKASVKSDEAIKLKISELSKQLRKLSWQPKPSTDREVLEIDRLIDRLYVDTEVPVRQMSGSASIYVDKVYLFMRTAFYYESEDKKSIYVCMLSSRERLQITSLENKYFLILEPNDMQKGLKGTRLSIKGMCRFNGTDIEVLSAKEIYTRLINEISEGKTSEQSERPVVRRRLGTTIERLSKLKDVASMTVQRYGDLLSNLRQIDCGVIVKRSYVIADDTLTDGLEEQFPISMDQGMKQVGLLSNSTKFIPISTISKQLNQQRLTVQCPESMPEKKKSLFESLCDEAEKRYQSLNK